MGVFSANINCSAGVWYTFFGPYTALAKTMSGTPTICLTIKEVRIPIKCWSRRNPKDFRWRVMTCWSDILYVLTPHRSVCLSYQTTSIWSTHHPVIDIGFDQYVISNIFPKTVIYSTSRGFTDWWRS